MTLDGRTETAASGGYADMTMTGLATAVAGFFGVAEEWGRTVRPPQPSEAPLSPNEWRGYEKEERKLNAGDRSVDSLNNRTEGCASQQRPRRHHGKSADLCADRSVGSDRRRLALVRSSSECRASLPLRDKHLG